MRFRPTPQTAIISRAAQRRIDRKREVAEASKLMADSLDRWGRLEPEADAPAHVAEAMKYVVTDSDDVEIIR